LFLDMMLALVYRPSSCAAAMLTSGNSRPDRTGPLYIHTASNHCACCHGPLAGPGCRTPCCIPTPSIYTDAFAFAFESAVCASAARVVSCSEDRQTFACSLDILSWVSGDADCSLFSAPPIHPGHFPSHAWPGHSSHFILIESFSASLVILWPLLRWIKDIQNRR
ncbi:hypothetical protein T11_6504, partial [Trichinella zimbabwensis]